MRAEAPADTFPGMRAPRSIWKYLVREVLTYSLLALLATSIVLVGNQLFRWLQDLVGAGIGADDLLAALGLFSTLLSVYALPVSLLLGILLAIGRMASDSETIAMRACGVGIAAMAVPILAISLVLCALLYPITLDAEPGARRELRASMLRIAMRGAALEPGRFEQLANRTFFVEERKQDGSFAGIVISDRSDPQRPMTIFAQEASVSMDDNYELRLELRRGDLHVELPDQAPEHYQRIAFARLDYSIDLSSEWNDRRGRRAKEMTLEELRETATRVHEGDAGPYREKEPIRYAIHLARRSALPFAPVLFAAAGLPLALLQRRNSRALGVIGAAGLAFGYYALQAFCETLAVGGSVAPSLAPWLPNGLYAALAVVLLLLAGRRGV